tara:strand:- start:966 stop:1238 length:273 start_codon:yes stop_codon:yes gene_type:complete
MSENYLDEVIEELYEVIIDPHQGWPLNTPVEKKIRLLQGMIKYFESKDTISDYKRCSKLKRYADIIKISDSLMIHKNQPSGSKSILDDLL